VETLGINSGEFTSFQGYRKTVINYAICSRSLFPKIVSFNVELQIDDYDHTALPLEVEIDKSLLGALALRTRKRKRDEIVLPDETELDKLLIQTLKAGKDEAKKSLKLYGPVYFNTNPILVTICGVCKNVGKHTASAGSAAIFGPDSNLNRAVRVWGNATNVRADLIALVVALHAAPRTKTLHVSTRSDFAIRSTKYYAFRNDATGWKGTNGDVLKLVIQMIQARSAPVHFIHIKKSESHLQYDAAKVMAEK
jgi:ribonuclease HI